MPRPDVAIATHAAHPEPADDDRRFVERLEARGLTVEARPWSAPGRPWTEARTIVIRSTWDYPKRRPEFLRWVARAARGRSMWNPPRVLRWNTDKSYLRRLGQRGIPIVPTREVTRARPRTWAAVVRGFGDRVVVKPRVSADGYLTAILESADDRAGPAHLREVLAHGPALVQPYLPAVEALGERSLIYLDGRYSHAVRRTPILRPGGRGGPEPSEPPPPAARRLAERVVDAAGARSLLYARVDLVPDPAGTYRLLELELTEPTLYLDRDPRAPERLALALLRRMLAARRPTVRTGAVGTARPAPRPSRSS